jgi:tetratricopeptide (TPR) repeat protein
LKALEINPERVETLIDAGRMELLLNEAESAMTHFAKAVEIDSGSAENHLWYAKALYKSGLIDKALQQIERTIELDPSNNEAQELKQKWQI